jgi:arginine N-succinyltransferase
VSAWRIVATPTGSTTHLACVDDAGATLGTAALDPAIGLDVPRYWFQVGCMVLAAPELRLFHRQRTLLLCNDHTGAAELRAIHVAEDARAPVEVARRLVRTALLRLRIAGQGTGAPEPALVAELPGVRTADGHSPFWDALGAHFHTGDPAAAAQRLGPDWRSHVAALLPREPLLVSFLAHAAQEALGRHAPSAAACVEALRAEGLRSGRYVTIDEAGPLYESPLDVLPGWRGARETLVRAGERGTTGTPCVLADVTASTFAEGVLDEVTGTAVATPDALDALGAAHGARLWATPLQ